MPNNEKNQQGKIDKNRIRRNQKQAREREKMRNEINQRTCRKKR